MQLHSLQHHQPLLHSARPCKHMHAWRVPTAHACTARQQSTIDVCRISATTAKQKSHRSSSSIRVKATAGSSPQTEDSPPPPEAVFKGCGYYIGPVTAIHAPGRGMGLATSRTLSSPGELLLISRPIAAVAAVAAEPDMSLSAPSPSPTPAAQTASTSSPSQTPAAPLASAAQPSSSDVSAAEKDEATGGDAEKEGAEGPSDDEDTRPRVFVPCYPEGHSTSEGSSTIGTSSGSGSGDVNLGEFESGSDALAAHMVSKRYTAQEVQWLEALAAGLPGSSLQEPPSHHSKQPGQSHRSDAESDQPSPSSSSPRPIPPLGSCHDVEGGEQDQPLPPTFQANSSGQPQSLDTFISQYAFQLHAEDLGIAQLQRREAAEQVTGIWPEQGLLNHSCVPSTVSYTSRGALITRLARRSIRSGAELFTNYLGDEVMSPLEVRQQALQSSFGFKCGCTRCKEEEKVDKNLMQLVLDVYESCHDQVREDLEEAIADGDFEALQRIKMQLAAYVEVIDAAFTKSGINERTQILLQAGLMQLYEELFIVAAALGERDLRLCEMLQALAASIQPGSDLHLFWARAHLQATKDDVAEAAAAQEAMMAAAQNAAQNPQGQANKKGARGKGRGRGGPGVGFGALGGADDRDAVMHADQLCFRAYQARYGAIPRRLYLTLLAKAGV